MNLVRSFNLANYQAIFLTASNTIQVFLNYKFIYYFEIFNFEILELISYIFNGVPGL